MTEVLIKPKSESTSTVVHKIGNWYRHEDGVTLVILSNVKGQAVLITTNGNFWTAPIDYGTREKPWELTAEQFDAITNGSHKFTLVSKITILEE